MNKERRRAEVLIPSPSSLHTVELLAFSSIFKTLPLAFPGNWFTARDDEAQDS